MSELVWAGIVVYNPDIRRLTSNIKAIMNQVDRIIVYNNGGFDISEFNKEEVKIDVIGDGNNKGVAYALNQLLKLAYDNGITWMLTLDQDSIMPPNAVESMKNFFDIQDIGIICPQAIDKRRLYLLDRLNKKNNEYVDFYITSGNLVRTKAWKNIDGYDDFLFIDLVDNDFCKNMRIHGWKILKMNSLVLDQEYGEIELKNGKIVSLIDWIRKKVRNEYLSYNIAKLSYKKNVSPLRVYYTNRNIIYLNKKYKKHNGIGYSVFNCNSYLGFWFTFNLPAIVRSKNKIKTIRAIFEGVNEGVGSRPSVIE